MVTGVGRKSEEVYLYKFSTTKAHVKQQGTQRSKESDKGGERRFATGREKYVLSSQAATTGAWQGWCSCGQMVEEMCSYRLYLTAAQVQQQTP